MAWRKATLTSHSGQVTHETTTNETHGLHVLKWRPGYVLMSADGCEVARFRIQRDARAWADGNGPKNPHPWTAEGVQRWRKDDPKGFEGVFLPLRRAGQYHLH